MKANIFIQIFSSEKCFFAKLMLLFAYMSVTSCSILGERSYEELMAKDDTDTFAPEQDFPVVIGDEGRTYRNYGEIMDRTPADTHSKKQYIWGQSIKNELSQLEEAQTSENFDQYSRYYDIFANDSERIFFLRIPTIDERREYLQSRGVIDQTVSMDSLEAYDQTGILTDDLIKGMSPSAVTRVLGKPEKVEYSTSQADSERWTYRYPNGRTRFIFFKQNSVEGWSRPVNRPDSAPQRTSLGP